MGDDSKQNGDADITLARSAVFVGSVVAFVEIIGKKAPVISELLSCGLSRCDDGWTTLQAQNLGTLAATFCVILITSYSSTRGKISNVDAVVAILAGITTALVSIIESTRKLDLTEDIKAEFFHALLIWAAIVFLFALPLVMAPGKDRARSVTLLYKRIGVALATGFVIGFLVQGVFQGVWNLIANASLTTGIPFFLRPSATVPAIAAWSLATFDPFMRRSAWADASRARVVAWISLYGIAAVVLGGFGVVRMGGGDWITMRLLTFLSGAALLLPGFFAVGLVMLTSNASFLRKLPTTGVVIAVVIGAAAGVAVAAPSDLSLLYKMLFALIHAVTAAAVLLIVILGIKQYPPAT